MKLSFGGQAWEASSSSASAKHFSGSDISGQNNSFPLGISVPCFPFINNVSQTVPLLLNSLHRPVRSTVSSRVASATATCPRLSRCVRAHLISSISSAPTSIFQRCFNTLGGCSAPQQHLRAERLWGRVFAQPLVRQEHPLALHIHSSTSSSRTLITAPGALRWAKCEDSD